MKILVVNAGSSSLKYQLFDMETGDVLAKGLCERIGIDGAITHKRPGKENYKAQASLGDHKAAVELVLKLLCVYGSAQPSSSATGTFIASAVRRMVPKLPGS